MKKLMALLLCAMLALGCTASLAESTEKTQIGELALRDKFELRCTLPEGYTVKPVDMGSDAALFSVTSEEPDKLLIMVSIAFDELLESVDRLNDLDDDALAQIAATFQEEDEVDVAYMETSHGTKVMVVKEVRDTVDYVDFYTIYKGYEIEMVLTGTNAAAADISDEQIQLAMDFLSELDFVEIN